MDVINRRFIETDYIKSIERKINPYITELELDSLIETLDLEWNDYTFKFYPIRSTTGKTRWNTVIINNKTDEKVHVDDLTGFAFDFYIRQIEDISVSESRRRIREKLFSVVGA